MRVHSAEQAATGHWLRFAGSNESHRIYFPGEDVVRITKDIEILADAPDTRILLLEGEKTGVGRAPVAPNDAPGGPHMSLDTRKSVPSTAELQMAPGMPPERPEVTGNMSGAGDGPTASVKAEEVKEKSHDAPGMNDGGAIPADRPSALPELPPPPNVVEQQPLRRGTRVRQPSSALCCYLEGNGVVSGCKADGDVPRGMQLPRPSLAWETTEDVMVHAEHWAPDNIELLDEKSTNLAMYMAAIQHALVAHAAPPQGESPTCNSNNQLRVRVQMSANEARLMARRNLLAQNNESGVPFGPNPYFDPGGANGHLSD